ncbi:HlyD family secretion protein [Chloroflexota bacterium]
MTLRRRRVTWKPSKIDLEQATDNFKKITYPYTYNAVYIDVPTALGFINDARNEINKAIEAMNTGEPGEVSFQLKQALDNLIESRDLLSRHGYGSDVFASEFLPMDKFWTLRAAQLQVDRVQLAVVNAENVVSKTALTVENTRTALSKVQLAEDKAKNDLDRALDELEKAVITAPFDGVIAKINVEEGDFLSVNYATTIAVEIIDPSRMELNFYMSELDIPNVKLGQKVSISVDALPDVHLDSVVTSISTLPIVQFGVFSYEVKVVFDVPQDSALRSGMSATADIINDKQS